MPLDKSIGGSMDLSNKLSFRKALNLADENKIYALLVDRSGRVLWRAEGVFDEGKASSLQTVLGLENP